MPWSLRIQFKRSAGTHGEAFPVIQEFRRTHWVATCCERGASAMILLFLYMSVFFDASVPTLKARKEMKRFRKAGGRRGGNPSLAVQNVFKQEMELAYPFAYWYNKLMYLAKWHM